MDSRLIVLKEFYEKADLVKMNPAEKTSNLDDFYHSYRDSLKEKIDPAFKSESDLEIQSRVIEILELEISKIDSVSAFFIMPRPFDRSWKSKGRYLYYFDSIKLKLAGLIYQLGNK